MPVGLPMAIVALGQIRRDGGRGAPLAWATIALSAVSLIVMCAQVCARCRAVSGAVPAERLLARLQVIGDHLYSLPYIIAL